MDMPHSLPAMGAGVEDDPVAVVGQALGRRHLVRVRDQLGQLAVAGGGQLSQVGMVSARYHEYVYGSLRIDIAEGDCPVFSGHYGRGYLVSGNGAEQTVGHAGDLNVWRAWNAADIYGCTTANPRCTTPLV